MLTASQICQMARYSVKDSGHVNYSDYELLTSLQAAIDVFVQVCSDEYSPILNKTKRILMIHGVGHLPADFHSILSVRELVKAKHWHRHHHHDHHHDHDRHHDDHHHHVHHRPGPPVAVLPDHENDDLFHRPQIIPPEDKEHPIPLPPLEHHHGRFNDHHYHSIPDDIDLMYGEQLTPDYETGPFKGFYRVDSDKIYTDPCVEYVELAYTSHPERLRTIDDTIDMPQKCELPLARMTKHILLDEFEAAAEVAGKFALSYKNQVYANPYKPELWGGYNPWA